MPKTVSRTPKTPTTRCLTPAGPSGMPLSFAVNTRGREGYSVFYAENWNRTNIKILQGIRFTA